MSTWYAKDAQPPALTRRAVAARLQGRRRGVTGEAGGALHHPLEVLDPEWLRHSTRAQSPFDCHCIQASWRKLVGPQCTHRRDQCTRRYIARWCLGARSDSCVSMQYHIRAFHRQAQRPTLVTNVSMPASEHWSCSACRTQSERVTWPSSKNVFQECAPNMQTPAPTNSFRRAATTTCASWSLPCHLVAVSADRDDARAVLRLVQALNAAGRLRRTACHALTAGHAHSPTHSAEGESPQHTCRHARRAQVMQNLRGRLSDPHRRPPPHQGRSGRGIPLQVQRTRQSWRSRNPNSTRPALRQKLVPCTAASSALRHSCRHAVN